MRQYIIDELRPGDYRKVKVYLDDQLTTGSIEGVYWMPLEKHLLNATQVRHRHCQPFYVALELTPVKLSCELLIRTQHQVRCDCIEYANETQRNWIIATIDAIFNRLDIYT
jgi:hypothetical protein